MGAAAWLHGAKRDGSLAWLLGLAACAVLLGFLRLPLALFGVPLGLLASGGAGLGGGLRAGFLVGLFASALSLLAVGLALDAKSVPELLTAAATCPLVGALSGRLRDAGRAPRVRAGMLLGLSTRKGTSGFWAWNLDDDHVTISESFRDLVRLGQTAQLDGLTAFLARVHPDDIARLRSAFDELRRNPKARMRIEHRLHLEDGSWVWVRTHAPALARREHVRELTAITERLSGDGERAQAAFTDPLTGLPGRALFADRVRQAVARRKRPPSSPLALMIVHLDDFDELVARNSGTLGDSVLVRLAERLESAVRQGDTVARWGPSEFAIALECVRDEAEAERFAEQIARAASAPLWVSGRDVRLQASVGTVLVRDSLQSVLALLRQAEVARELAQRQGPGQRVLFDALGQSEWGTRPPFETLLREALSRGGVQVYFQPIVSLPARRVTGFEALLRWQDPSFGTMLPAEVVAVAEESGLIGELDAFVLREACATLKALRAQQAGAEHLYVAVNVSTRELEGGALVPLVRDALEDSGLPGAALAVEVREAALMNEALDAGACLSALRALGVHVHMDDFGTGYSSLSYLHRVALDALKVDASCVRELRQGDDEIVRTAVTLGRALQMRVIAEGVETEAELAALSRLGCAEAQGHLFGVPLPKSELEAFLRQHESAPPSESGVGSRA